MTASQPLNKVKKHLAYALTLIGLVLALDQFTKIWVKTSMILNSRHHVFGDWFIIHFTENPGMAYGLELGGEYGKLILTLLRIVAVCGLSYYLYRQIKQGATLGFILCLALITAGAAGNIIDSVFYGIIFTDSDFRIAEMFPAEGYASLFHGKVVDMIYLPVIDTYLPEWLGGERFVFFRPIFNLADTSISLGVIFILLFQRRYFLNQALSDSPNEVTAEETSVHDTASDFENAETQEEASDSEETDDKV